MSLFSLFDGIGSVFRAVPDQIASLALEIAETGYDSIQTFLIIYDGNKTAFLSMNYTPAQLRAQMRKASSAAAKLDKILEEQENRIHWNAATIDAGTAKGTPALAKEQIAQALAMVRHAQHIFDTISQSELESLNGNIGSQRKLYTQACALLGERKGFDQAMQKVIASPVWQRIK